MTRHAVWRAAYRQRRYLEFASREQLVPRFRGLIDNIRELAPDGKLTVGGLSREKERLWRLFSKRPVRAQAAVR